jgi:hypothetical protein
MGTNSLRRADYDELSTEVQKMPCLIKMSRKSCSREDLTPEKTNPS